MIDIIILQNLDNDFWIAENQLITFKDNKMYIILTIIVDKPLKVEDNE